MSVNRSRSVDLPQLRLEVTEAETEISGVPVTEDFDCFLQKMEEVEKQTNVIRER